MKKARNVRQGFAGFEPNTLATNAENLPHLLVIVEVCLVLKSIKVQNMESESPGYH